MKKEEFIENYKLKKNKMKGVKNMLKTIFMGTPEFAIPSLEKVFQKTDLKLIFTKEDKVNARGNKIVFSPVKQFGLDNDIEVIQPKRRGASPIHSAILNGDTESGVSIMYIEEELDAGDVILKEYCTISEEDTLGTLHDRLKELGAVGLEKALKLIENGEVKAEKQDESKVSFVKPISKEETKIKWNNIKEVIFNQVRGLNPFPGAYTENDKGEVIKVYKTEKIDKEYSGEYGQVVEILSKKGPVIKTQNGGLILLEVKYQGKKVQTGVDILNGRKIKLNEILK